MKYHDLGEEAPRLIHHIVRDPDLLRALLEAYFEEYQQTLRQVWPLIDTLLVCDEFSTIVGKDPFGDHEITQASAQSVSGTDPRYRDKAQRVFLQDM